MIQLFVSIILITIMAMACGEDSYEKVKPTYPPTEPVKPVDPTKPPVEPNVDAKALAVAAIQNNCVSCHNGVIQAPSLKGEAAVDANRARICIRVGTGSMPPTGGLSPEAKDQILKGLDC